MTSSRPTAATDRLRRENTALVLRSLRDKGSASRALLAQRTGLAKATVSAIVAELAQSGAVSEPDDVSALERSGRSGRPGRLLELHGASIVGLGLEVNVDYLAATALDLSGRTVLSRQLPARHADPNGLLRLARESVERLTTQGRSLLGVTLAVPGQVDRRSGRVVIAPNLHWHDRDVTTDLTRVVGEVPVRVDNDANCAAAGEAAFGAARGADHLLYLTGTVGVGAGIVVDGQVQRGAHGLAGEIGHAPLGEPGRRCACGRSGCWETAVGLNALLRETAATVAAVGLSDPVAAATCVAARCQAGDVLATEGVERFAHRLAAGLVTLAATLDPQLVVLGGSFVPLGPWLLPVVRREVAAMSAAQVELSTLGLHAASTGAAADVLGQVYAGTLALL